MHSSASWASDYGDDVVCLRESLPSSSAASSVRRLPSLASSLRTTTKSRKRPSPSPPASSSSASTPTTDEASTTHSTTATGNKKQRRAERRRAVAAAAAAAASEKSDCGSALTTEGKHDSSDDRPSASSCITPFDYSTTSSEVLVPERDVTGLGLALDGPGNSANLPHHRQDSKHLTVQKPLAFISKDALAAATRDIKEQAAVEEKKTEKNGALTGGGTTNTKKKGKKTIVFDPYGQIVVADEFKRSDPRTSVRPGTGNKSMSFK